MILGIDPGPVQSGFCLLDMDSEIVEVGKRLNPELREFIRLLERRHGFYKIACEGMVFQGRGFGKDSIQTCYEIGRLQQLTADLGIGFQLYTRFEYGRYWVIEGSLTDSTLRAALERCYGSSAKKGDPLYQLKGPSDKRSAFALAKYHAIKLRAASTAQLQTS